FTSVERSVKEKLGFSVVFADSVPSQTLDSLRQVCEKAPYVSACVFMSADDVLAYETGGNGRELVEQIGFNPYAPMLEVRVKAAYANVDSLDVIATRWKSLDVVDEVPVNTEMVGNLQRNADMLNLVLLVMAAMLLLISFVLINNTVRLTIYSRRFLIHTMKLVGAKGAFIRRPFLMSNALQGLVAGLIASGLLLALTGWLKDWYQALGALLTWGEAFAVCAVMTVAGVVICVIAALLATNRYLRSSYDDMFE
ncbi:MAG: permease-like cell division protein FtsX, partial [Muribaculaceae bacterium]|nr:permease-like cell division protein FtsX [Muribaculaceae bacterium]